jgi:ribosomal-protein-alanine N-acetyltransferase
MGTMLNDTLIAPSRGTGALPRTRRPDVSDWRLQVPVLHAPGFDLREVEPGDAASLLAMLTTPEVTRFITPPPRTLEGFERFIGWARAQRAAGTFVCFAVVPQSCNEAVGVFQLKSLAPGFGVAELGFAIGSEFWGSGIFGRGARLALDYAFDVIGVGRVEARSVVENDRGNRALRKLGAIEEGLLRQSFLHQGQYVDQLLWSILPEDWFSAKTVWAPVIH